MRASFLSFGLLLLAPQISAASIPLLSGPAQCDKVTLSSDSLECNETSCVLRENAQLTCDHIRVQADQITVDLTEESSFAGARAIGNVIMLDGANVIRCKSVHLDAGQIKGSIQEATVQNFRTPEAARPFAVTSPAHRQPGTTRQTIEGNIERKDANLYTVTDASFTWCDCGSDQNPSWRLLASEINVNPEERATLWWPRFEMNFLGLFRVPIPAPTPVLSLPINRRAAGLLAPQIAFLRFPYPTIDFPLFIPMTDAFDLTIRPGFRSDWGLHRSNQLSTWSAPRLGARFRMAPFDGFRLSFDAQWTRDTHSSAARIANRNDSHDGLEDRDLQSLAQNDPRWGLRDRIMLNLDQSWRIAPGAQWNIRGQWVSDDYYQRDFSIQLEDRVSQYLPTRSRLDWHGRHLLFHAELDYLQRLNNGTPLSGYSNTNAHEGAAWQRLPAMELWLLPWELGSRIFVSSGFSGNYFSSLVPSQEHQLPSQWSFYNQTRIHFLDQLGPVQVDAGFTNHLISLVTAPSAEESGSDLSAWAFPMFESRITTSLARHFESWTHMVQPYTAFRNSLRPAKDRPEGPPDHHVDIGTMQQAELGVIQSWLPRRQNDARRIDLTIRQPVSFTGNDAGLLPTELTLGLRGLSGVSAQIRASLDWAMAENGPVDLGAILTWQPVRAFRWFGYYGRMAPGVERLSRSIHELSRNTAEISDVPWVHYIRSGLELRSTQSWKLLYQTDVLLPKPGDDSSAGTRFGTHLVRAGYQSPCECWGIDIIAQMAHPDGSAGSDMGFFDNMTMRVNLTIGDYTVGSP